MLGDQSEIMNNKWIKEKCFKYSIKLFKPLMEVSAIKEKQQKTGTGHL